jgi:hypothetical protein
MRRRLVGGSIALLVGALAAPHGSAVAQEPCDPLPAGGCPTPTPTPTPTPAPTVTPQPATVALQTDPDNVVFRTTPAATLRGTLTSTAASVAGVRVQLTGRAAPFGKVTVTRKATADTAGAFSFRVRPRVNTVYRVDVLPGQAVTGVSPRIAVHLFPKLALTGTTGKTSLRLGMTVRGPKRIVFKSGGRAVQRGTARRAVFYARLKGDKLFRRVGSGRLSKVRCGSTCTRTAAVTITKASVLRRIKNVGVCTQGTAFRGLGVETPCGAPRKSF